MSFRRYRYASGRAAKLGLAALLLSGGALAQSKETAEDSDSTKATSPDPASADPDKEPAEKEPATKEEPAAAALPAEPAPPKGAEKPTEATVAVEVLPGSAYPEPSVRGIKGGSLSMTIPGLQWPYLPRVAGGPSTRVGFSGSAWADTSYRSVTSGIPDTDPSVHEWRQQARMVLRMSPTFDAGEGWFLQAQGELALLSAAPSRADEFINADDLYVRVGKWNVVDLTAGRFQGWEVYHLGMGLDLNTLERDGAITENNAPVGIYGVTDLWDRPNGPGHLAVHVYPTDFLRFEVLGEIGSSNFNQIGARPVGILDLGALKVKAGFEYEKQTPRQQSAAFKDSLTRRGFGGALQIVLDPYVEFGANAAQELVDANNQQGTADAGKSTTTNSVGGFANGRIVGPLLVGVGGNYTHEHNLKVNAATGENDIRTHLQVFGALQYSLWDRFYIKGVFSYAKAEFNPLSDPPPVAKFENSMISGRLRLMYLF